MADIALPSQDFAKFTIELEQNFQVNTSVWTGRTRKTQVPGAQKWYVRAEYEPIATEEEERPYRAFFAQARGPIRSFNIQVACSQRTGSNPTVRAGAGPANTLPLAGLPASATALLAGQYMAVPLPSGHVRLVLLTANLAADASGNATAIFEPLLGETPATGATVETINPYLPATMAEARHGWTTDNGVTIFAIDAVEAL
ncbi:hypothetical protein PX699_13310 [Sphingobium sp. H39-3-25]|uniref:hypothetical protein n=1 Tax=Sphingobium arseniciresistens TaxID=3030834 RepID=UPI0023B93DD2|nr:hypothetical protein [Sphingobium arseniciresistens]